MTSASRNELYHIDLYKILGLPPNCTNNDIEKKYLELAKIYHPDNTRLRYKNLIASTLKKYTQGGKIIPNQTVIELEQLMISKISENTKIFNLVNNAYSKLTTQRADYDKEYNEFQKHDFDFLKQKTASLSYNNSQLPHDNQYIKQQESTYHQTWQSMNVKHGYNETDAKSINEPDMKKKFQDLTLQRTQQDTLYKPEKILDPQNLNRSQFNLLFEKINKKDYSTELTEHGGVPVASNIGINSSLCTVDKIEDIYTDYKDDLEFSPADFSKNTQTSISQSDLESIKNLSYNEIESKLTKSEIDKKMMDRDNFDKQVSSWDRSQYSTNIDNRLSYDTDNTIYNTLEFGDSDTQKQYNKLISKQDIKFQTLQVPQTKPFSYTYQSTVLEHSSLPPTSSDRISNKDDFVSKKDVTRNLDDIIMQRGMQDIQFKKSIH